MKRLCLGIVTTGLGVAIVVAGAAVARSEANRVQLSTALNAAQEVPTPSGSVGDARGSFTATTTRSGTGATVAWRLTFSGLTGAAVAAHIHTAPRGEPGPVSVPLCAPCESGQTGTATISNATVLEAINAGRTYVNVHTRANPAGEVRGQLGIVANIRTALSARREVPRPKGGVNRARGTFTATATKSGASAVVTWQLAFSGLTGRALAAHIHIGRRGVAGRVALTLCAPCGSGVRGRATLRGSTLAALEAGRAYVNIHTRRNPGGEDRGQIGAVPLTVTT